MKNEEKHPKVFVGLSQCVLMGRNGIKLWSDLAVTASFSVYLCM